MAGHQGLQVRGIMIREHGLVSLRVPLRGFDKRQPPLDNNSVISSNYIFPLLQNHAQCHTADAVRSKRWRESKLRDAK